MNALFIDLLFAISPFALKLFSSFSHFCGVGVHIISSNYTRNRIVLKRKLSATLCSVVMY